MNDNGSQPEQPRPPAGQAPYDGPAPDPDGYTIIAELQEVKFNPYHACLGARWVCGCCEGITVDLGSNNPAVIHALTKDQTIEGTCNRCGAKLRIRKQIIAAPGDRVRKRLGLSTKGNGR